MSLIRRSFLNLTLGVIFPAMAAFAASAAPITWTLENVTDFCLTGTCTDITGSFVFNADTVTYSNINISTSGGNVIPNVSWLPIASCSIFSAADALPLLDTAPPHHTAADLSHL